MKLWLECPLHNRRPELLELFESVCAGHRHDPADDNVSKRLNRSYLLSAIEEYLFWEDGRPGRSPDPLDTRLLRILRRRGLEKHFNKQLNRQQKALKKRLLPNDFGALYQRYRFEELAQQRFLDHNRKLPESYREPDRLAHLLSIITVLRQSAISLAARPFATRLDPQPLLLAALKQSTKVSDRETQPLLFIYYQLNLYYLGKESGTSPVAFAELCSYFRERIDTFSHAECTTIHKLLLNLAISRINYRADEEHLGVAFQLYGLGLNRQLLTRGGLVSNFTFSNVMGIALRLREITFAEEFLASYATRLPSATATEIVSLARARLAYAKGDGDATLRHLQSTDYRDTIHLLNARMLQLRVYYERGDHQLLLDLMHATRMLLRRRKSGYHRQIYANNLRLLRQLVKLNHDNEKAVRRLRERIEATNPLSEKEWLLEKMQAYESRQ